MRTWLNPRLKFDFFALSHKYVFNIQLIMSNGYDPTLGASQECKHCLENMAEDSLR